jgi:hypothetical protein
MPQIFRIGSYSVYFWSNEGRPLEPIQFMLADVKNEWHKRFGEISYYL